MSVRCGNHTTKTYHDTAEQVRECFLVSKDWYAESGSISDVKARITAEEARVPAQRQPVDNGAVERLARAHANNPHTAHVLASVGAGNQWRDDNPFGDEATTNQITYIEGLIEKRDLTGIKPATHVVVMLVREGHRTAVTFEAARSALDELTKLSRKPRQTDADSPQGEQGTRTKDSGLVARIKALKALVPDGRYACKPDGVGQDKLHFYLVQTGKTGHVFVKEYASDTLWPVSFPSYEAILGQIVRDDPEYAGVLFGQEYGACRKCGRGLTDENNPYKEIGYGPDCGAKL